jgi:LysR family transcriptional regulator for metE and metH
METKYFRLIKTIAEEGNMANSAKRLFLTHSALSHQLRELEERLGFKVFDRKRNTWQLTEEGIELHKLSVEVLDTIDKGFEKIDYIKSGEKGKIRIGTKCYYFINHLLTFIKKMNKIYPEIEVEIVDDFTKDSFEKIMDNELDIAITQNKSFDSNLLSKELFQEEIFAFAHKNHFFNTKKYIDVRHFSDVQLFIQSNPLDSDFIYSHFLKPNNVTPKKVTTISMTEIALGLVNNNEGVICKPKWALEPFKGFDNIVSKKIGKNGLHRTHFLTIREEDKNKKYISDFISNFEEEFCCKV